MNLEIIRKSAIKAGIVQGNATSVPMHKLESFAHQIKTSAYDELASKLETMPLNDTAASIATWIREQK